MLDGDMALTAPRRASWLCSIYRIYLYLPAVYVAFISFIMCLLYASLPGSLYCNVGHLCIHSSPELPVSIVQVADMWQQDPDPSPLTLRLRCTELRPPLAERCVRWGFGSYAHIDI